MALAEGVREVEREPDCVSVRERVVERLTDAEAEGGVVALAPADAVFVALEDADAHALPLPPAEGRCPLRVGEPDTEGDAEGKEDSVSCGDVPTVDVDVCDAEEERVEDAEPDADAVPDTLGVPLSVTVLHEDTEALPLTSGDTVPPAEPVTVREGAPETERAPLAVAQGEGDPEPDAVREEREEPDDTADTLAEGVSVAELVPEALVELQCDGVKVAVPPVGVPVAK